MAQIVAQWSKMGEQCLIDIVVIKDFVCLCPFLLNTAWSYRWSFFFCLLFLQGVELLPLSLYTKWN